MWLCFYFMFPFLLPGKTLLAILDNCYYLFCIFPFVHLLLISNLSHLCACFNLDTPRSHFSRYHFFYGTHRFSSPVNFFVRIDSSDRTHWIGDLFAQSQHLLASHLDVKSIKSYKTTKANALDLSLNTIHECANTYLIPM